MFVLLFCLFCRCVICIITTSKNIIIVIHISILPILYLTFFIHVVIENCIFIIIDGESVPKIVDLDNKKKIHSPVSSYCWTSHLTSPILSITNGKQISVENIRTVKENINEVRQTVKSITFMTSQHRREFVCEKNTPLSLSRIKYRLLHLQWRSHERAYID